jgi:hypothetical protein
MRGSVISVPLPPDSTGTITATNDLEAPYQIQLIDGSIFSVSPRRMEDIIDYRSVSDTTSYSIPSWLGAHQKVMCLQDGAYFKGFMEYDLDRKMWRCIQRRRNGTEILGVDFPTLSQDFKVLVDDGILLPGWHSNSFLCSRGSANHASAVTLVDINATGSFWVALHVDNPDGPIWKASYSEEYTGLTSNSTFDIISESQYHSLCRQYGIKAIPSMVIFMV